MTDTGDTYLLLYDYVDDVLTKRAPHRPAHLEKLEVERTAGRLMIAGPFGDPPVGAAIGFTGVSREQVEAWSDADPYMLAGLVRSRAIHPWKLV
jgi:uncharacterized protein YciI